MLRLIFAVILSLACLLSGTAKAEDARRAGTVRLERASGGLGPIVLRKDGDGHAAELVIVNDGKEPLVVSRIAVRGDAADPRVPSKITAKLSEGSLPITIAPGASRKASVRWTPERSTRQRQLFGHVVVTTSDEIAGDVAMGVRADADGLLGPIEAHLLSLLVGLPLLAAVGTLLLRGSGARHDRTVHLMAVVALGFQALLAAWVYVAFTPDVSRVDGNDGLQFVEHVVWFRRLSAELYLGADGIAAAGLFVTSAITFLALLSKRTIPSATSGYHAALLVLDAAVMGALASMDGLLFLFFSSVAITAATILVGAWGGAGRGRAAMRLAVPGAVAMILLAVALIAVARHSDPTFLVDGTKVTTTFSLPELSRVALGVKGASLFGLPLSKVGFALVLVSSLLLLAAFPAHRWLADVLVEAPAATGMLVSTALPLLGLCALLRFGCAVLPEGMRWASGVVVALGAVTAAYGALCALGQTDLRRMAAYATTTQAGFVLLGAGSLTPQGLSGAIVLGTTRALACGVFLMVVAVIQERVRTSDVSRLGGVATQMPAWAGALAASGLAQAGALGLGGAWGPVLSLLGVLSSYAPLAIVAAVGLVMIAAAHMAAVSRIAFGRLDPEWTSPYVEGDGGLRDLTTREAACIAPLLFLVLLFGAWPAPVVSVTTGTVRDLANAVSPPGPDQVAGL